MHLKFIPVVFSLCDLMSLHFFIAYSNTNILCTIYDLPKCIKGTAKKKVKPAGSRPTDEISRSAFYHVNNL